MKRRKFLIAFLGIVFLLALYLPYIIEGGFIVDDWGVIIQKGSLLDEFRQWFPLFSNRPLAPVYLTIVHRLFGDVPLWYILLNLVMWLSSVAIICNALKRIITLEFMIVFFAFASVPVISSSALFSPVMMGVNTFSILMWSLSLLSISNYQFTKQRKWLVLSVLNIIVALLVYEIILPLLVLNVFYVFIVEGVARSDLRRNIMLYVLPILMVIIGIFVYQKVLVPKFSITYSRLPDGFISFIFTDGIKIFIQWLLNVLVSFPILIFSSIGYLIKTKTFNIELLPIFIITICYLGYIRNSIVNFKSTVSYRFGIVLILAFLSASSLFILSGTPPDISGYLNRALSSTWLLFAMLIAFIVSWFGKYTYLIVFPLFLLTANSFIIQRNEFVESSRLQIEIASDTIQTLRNTGAESGATVLGNVPKYLLDNYNNENVFGEFWDYGFALKHYSNDYIVGGNTLTKYKDFDIVNGKLLIEGYWSPGLENVWYYEYNQFTGKSYAEEITDLETMMSIATGVMEKEVFTTQISHFPNGKNKELLDNISSLRLRTSLKSLRDIIMQIF